MRALKPPDILLLRRRRLVLPWPPSTGSAPTIASCFCSDRRDHKVVGPTRSPDGGCVQCVERDFAARLRLAHHQPWPTPPATAASSSPTAGGGGIVFLVSQEQFTADDFELSEIYGVGSYSKVVRAKKDTGSVYALNIMDKRFITKEIRISYVKMERIVLDHLGVIRLFFTFQDSYSLC